MGKCFMCSESLGPEGMHYGCERDAHTLQDLWHTSRVALADRLPTRRDRLEWVADQYVKTHKDVGWNEAYRMADLATRPSHPV